MTALAYGEALKKIGGLSRTSKLPWYSWSISAEGCITGSKLRELEGSTCSGCYAMKGMYRFPNVKTALSRREEALSDPQFVDAFIVVLNDLHRRSRLKDQSRYFRWFDAGDIRSLEHLEQINAIALGTPDINHWLPTRENGFVKAFIDKHGEFASNLVVRLSAPMIDERPSKQPFGLPYSTVADQAPVPANEHLCPANKQEGECGDCRACWKFEQNISYPLH